MLKYFLICLLFVLNCRSQQRDWQLIYKNQSGGFIKAISAVDEYNYIISLEYSNKLEFHSKILLTKDGGITFQELFHSVNLYEGLNIKALSYNSPENIVAVGNDYNVYSTNNLGKNWDTIKLKDVKQEISPGFISFCDSLNGVISFLSHDSIFYTKDGGYNWSKLPNTNVYVQYIKMFDTNTVYFMTYGDSTRLLFRTFDFGKTWDTLYLPPITYKCEFPDKDNGYAIGDGQVPYTDYVLHFVYKTTNGGKDWVKIREVTYGTMQITNISFLDSNNGLISEVFNGIYRTSDGGNTWNWEKTSKPLESKFSTITHLLYKNLGEGLFIATMNCQIYKFEINTSVYETPDESEVLYPNPSSDIIFLKKDNIETFNYEISDITSKVYLKGNYNQNGIMISELPSGLYFLKLFIGSKFLIYKFVKM
jgi:photosystem II stability/assembly factor-like uncharacterized protein